MMSRLANFMKMPPSRRRQRLSLLRDAWVTRWLYGPRLRSMAPGAIVGKPVFWTPEYIELGRDVLIWPGCRFEGIDLDPAVQAGPPPAIVIGDGVSFQQHCHVTAARRVEVGAGTSVLFGVMITDTDHRYDHPDTPIGQQPLDIRPTRIGANCFIGARASIQAGTQLGRHCIVGTNAVVRGIFPDHSVIVGAPARIVKRFDPSLGMWRRTDAAGTFLPTPGESRPAGGSGE